MDEAAEAKKQMGPNAYVACLYYRPGDVSTGYERAEMTRSEVQAIHERGDLINSPVRIEHVRVSGDETAGLHPSEGQHNDVAGRVVRTFVDPRDGSLFCVFTIDAHTNVGLIAKGLIEKGAMRMVSMTHDGLSKRGKEIAITSKAARPFTDIIDCNQAAEQDRAAMCIAFEPSNPLYVLGMSDGTVAAPTPAVAAGDQPPAQLPATAPVPAVTSVDGVTTVFPSVGGLINNAISSGPDDLAQILRGLGYGASNTARSPDQAARAINESAAQPQEQRQQDNVPAQIMEQLRQDAQRNASLHDAMQKLTQSMQAYVEETKRSATSATSTQMQIEDARPPSFLPPPPAALPVPAAAAIPPPPHAAAAAATSDADQVIRKRKPDDADVDMNDRKAKQRKTDEKDAPASADDEDVKFETEDDKEVVEAMSFLEQPHTLSMEQRSKIQEIMQRETVKARQAQRELAERKSKEQSEAAAAAALAEKRANFAKLLSVHGGRNMPLPPAAQRPAAPAAAAAASSSSAVVPVVSSGGPSLNPLVETLQRQMAAAAPFAPTEYREAMQSILVDCNDFAMNRGNQEQARALFVMKQVSRSLANIEQQLKNPDYSKLTSRLHEDVTEDGVKRIVVRPDMPLLF